MKLPYNLFFDYSFNILLDVEGWSLSLVSD